MYASAFTQAIASLLSVRGFGHLHISKDLGYLLLVASLDCNNPVKSSPYRENLSLSGRFIR